MTNRELAELMFSKMKTFGFTPYEIDYGDGYFLFDMGQDSVVHFRIKQVWKNWKFGMWIHSDSLNNYDEEANKDTPWEKEPDVVQIFCQHEHTLDKFKPSRSSLCVTYKPCDIKNEWNDYNLRNMLKMIKYHPLMCYEEFCGDRAGYYERRTFLLPFIESESDYIFRDLEETFKKLIFLNYTRVKLFLMRRFSKVLVKAELYDFEKENPGWSTDYLYKVNLTLKDVEDDKIFDFLDFWFHKQRYGCYGCFKYDCIVEVSDCVSIEGKEEPFWIEW